MPSVSIILVFTLLIIVAFAEPDWPEKHGPTADGIVPAASAKQLPLEWDGASGKNIAWKTPLEDEGHSTPVIGGGRIWFTSATHDGKKQFVYGIDQESGKILHHKLLFENPNPEPLGNDINNYAAPSPALEDDALYVHFGTYGTARLDPETAEVVWQRRDINARHFRGPGSSPIIFENLLILTFDGIDVQYTIALDKETGETVWKTPRSTDYGDIDAETGQPKREGDFRKAYGTPAVANVKGTDPQLISVGSRAAFGYDARTGKELWTITHDNYNAGVRPLWYPDLGFALLNTGSSKAHLVAVTLDATTKGNVNETHVAWNRSKRNSQFAIPVRLGDHFYQLDSGGILTCATIADGEVVWAERLPDTYVASPILVGNRIYFFNEQGLGTVIEANPDELRILAENTLEEGMTASPVVADGDLFLRTKGHLYRIGNP